jgi:hypothetical protein
MKRRWIIALATSLLVGGAEAQIASGGLTPGTVLEVRLLAPVNSERSQADKQVTAAVTKVVSGDATLVPLDSKVLGRVTEVQKRDKAHPEARLRIVFDQIQVKQGETLAFVGVIEKVSAEYPGEFRCDRVFCGWGDWGGLNDILSQYRYTNNPGRGILILSQKRTSNWATMSA